MQNTTPTAETPDTAPEYSGRATYEPESNKLRLYVGRVPRDEYLKLRAEGWTALHKQREAGGGDFVATWTPERRDTALEYAGIIEDEDMSTADRAADRAERFAEYREKRTGEATGAADRYDAGPAVHGFQSQARAERSARRHDRIAGRACDAWSKAEYWQSRTAGVISHALHVSSPSVRMGRIKTLETELRGVRARWEVAGQPLSERAQDWVTHLTLRLVYENQMLEAQGGRAGVVEIIPGGFFKGAQIHKVNKSSVTGRVVSVAVRVPRVDGWAYQITNVPGTDYALMQMDAERAPPEAYRAPTEQELADYVAARKSEKAAKPKGETIPLVNPTDVDAERLQAALNEKVRARWAKNAADRPYSYTPEFKPAQIVRIAQAVYSERSKGTYAHAKASSICGGGIQEPTAYNYDGRFGTPVCKVRTISGENYMADRVIIITDKPQKALPAAVWVPVKVAEAVTA
jgi:hypothetical protein